MTEITLGFEVHQPLRLNRVFNEDLVRGRTVAPDELFDIYFNNVWNRGILSRVAKKCYYPSNELMLENIDRYKSEKKKFKLAYSISGVLLEQCELWERDLLDSFKQLAETGLVEFLDQTYYHSLASLYPDRTEFIEQVNNHRQLMK
ncbi:MAG: alpha-amylase, partial [Fidelibacterota bacterium]